jgi:hypothetical protein
MSSHHREAREQFQIREDLISIADDYRLRRVFGGPSHDIRDANRLPAARAMTVVIQ